VIELIASQNWFGELKIVIAFAFLAYFAYEDYKKQSFPFKLLLAFVAVGFLSNLWDFEALRFAQNMISSVIIGLLGIFLWAIKSISDGDVWLLFGLALFFPFEATAILGVATLILGGLSFYSKFIVKKVLDKVPFAPFLLIAFLLVFGVGYVASSTQEMFCNQKECWFAEKLVSYPILGVGKAPSAEVLPSVPPVSKMPKPNPYFQ